MALNIKNAEVERLATKVAKAMGVSKTEAVRTVLAEKDRELDVQVRDRVKRVTEWLEKEVWPNVPPELLGKRLTREEEDEILGYGPNGYCE